MPLGLDLTAAADGILRIAATAMSYAVKGVTTERGLDGAGDRQVPLPPHHHRLNPIVCQRARELGDLRENAEYAAAKERQRLVEAREVKVGALIEGMRVVDGVKPGEHVIVDGLQRAFPGAPVTPPPGCVPEPHM